MDAPNKFGASNRSATADRSPRRIATWAASGVAVPLAFFCTLFFRHRKKSVSAPWDTKSHSRAVVGASVPTRGKGYAPAGSPKGFPLVLWKPSGTEAGENPMGHQIPLPSQSRRTKPPQQRIFLRHSCRTPMQAGGFPRSKRSARIALPCAPLVGYLNFRLLSAIGSHTRRVHDFLSASPRSCQSPRHGGAPSIPQPLFPKIKPSAP